MGFWHSGEGRYRLFTDQQRREYGRMQSEKLRTKWHAKYISKWTLLHERGWSQEALEEFLGWPFVDTNEPTDAYRRDRVERIEKGKRWQTFIEQQKTEKEDWELNCVSKSLLKEAGWTESALKRFLPEPIRKGRFVKYRREDVKKAEESEEFKQWKTRP